MSSKYVPPHMRRNNTHKPPSAPVDRLMTLGAPNLDDKDFVPLVSQPSPRTAVLPNWKNVASESPRAEEVKISQQPIIHKKVHRPQQLLYEAYEEEYDSEHEEVTEEKKEDDGWTVVEKKVKQKRDKVQDALDNGDAALSDEDAEDSVWNDQPEEYETYWDRKP